VGNATIGVDFLHRLGLADAGNLEGKHMQFLADIVRIHARERPHSPAIDYFNGGHAWTFAMLDRESNQVANALARAGVEAGDRVAYLDKNAPEYFTYLFGTAKLNAVSVAVNWRLAPPEMAFILNDSGARVLLVGEDFLGHLKQIELVHNPTVVVIGDPGDSGHPSYDQWIDGVEEHDPATPAHPQDTCYQLYTSGTTGLPKGVEITHDNFFGALEQGLADVGMNADSINLVAMPLFHIAGSGWGLVGLHAGARTVLLRDVDLPKILEAIPRYRVTHALFVPAVLQFLMATPGIDDADLSTLQTIVYGASPITEPVLVQAMKVFGCRFMQAYGLTETTGAVAILRPEDHDPGGPRAHLLRSCGRPVPPNRIRIVDPDTLEDVAEGEVGEIWNHGRQNMKGYWNNPGATAATIDADGWLRTGDAGYLKDGFLYIHDRVKDMIISGGENIYPAEIENALLKHPGIADAAVIGVPSERWGETPMAMVVRKDESLTEEAVISFCRTQLAHYKCPTAVTWLEALPRNPSGKILKTELREPFWRGRERRVS
jgi:long-chain acyl-CoA synthetase